MIITSAAKIKFMSLRYELVSYQLDQSLFAMALPSTSLLRSLGTLQL